MEAVDLAIEKMLNKDNIWELSQMQIEDDRLDEEQEKCKE